MTGHSPPATVAAVRDQLGRGITAMLPTEDAVVVGEELQRRFGLPKWQITLSATDANRHAIRYARMITGRPKIAVHDWCYHGTVDETFAVLDDAGRTVARPGNIGPRSPLDQTTVVVEYNDLAGLERALADRRRRRGADGARAHQHRHRAPRAGLPRGRARAHPALRRAVDRRRDALHLDGPGRLDRVGSASSPTC